jgi:hypothetical protein
MNRTTPCRTALPVLPMHALACLPWLVALAWPAALQAQTSAPVAAPAASRAAPPAAPRLAPRRLSTSELLGSATAPGELRPERPVVPQIVIPLGKGTPATTPPARTRRDSPAPAAAAIDDRAARCEAQTSAAARARCHDRLAHQDPHR